MVDSNRNYIFCKLGRCQDVLYGETLLVFLFCEHSYFVSEKLCFNFLSQKNVTVYCESNETRLLPGPVLSG